MNVDSLTVKFSRHAKRRIKLYDIKEDDIIKTLKQEIDAIKLPEEEKQEIINDKLSIKYGLPVKIVFIREKNTLHVVTAYPLKGSR